MTYEERLMYIAIIVVIISVGEEGARKYFLQVASLVCVMISLAIRLN